MTRLQIAIAGLLLLTAAGIHMARGLANPGQQGTDAGAERLGQQALPPVAEGPDALSSSNGAGLFAQRKADPDTGYSDPLVSWEHLPVVEPLSMSAGLWNDRGHWRGRPALGDLNGDGHGDLVASLRKLENSEETENGLFVWLGDGNGHWTPSMDGIAPFLGYGGATLDDADGDGDLDIVFASHAAPPQVFLNDGSARWTNESLSFPGATISSDVAIGDLIGDGQLEIVSIAFFSDENAINLFGRTGNGWTLDSQLVFGSAYGTQIHVEDLDGDGRDDLYAATNHGVKVWLGSTAGLNELSTGLPEPLVGGSDLGMDALDVDGDGMQELLVAGMVYEGHPPLLLRRYDGEQWTAFGSGFPADQAYFDAVFADLDGVGLPEIVAVGKHTTVIFTIDEKGAAQAIARLSGTKGVVNIAVGNVDSDPQDELALVGFGGVRVFDVDSVLRGSSD